MAINTKVLRGSAILSLNEVVGYGCSFVRSWILARVLSKGDYGVAATLTVTFLFLEFIGKMAFGQQIITSKHGRDRKFVDTAHTVQLALGMFSAVLFLLLARPLAGILGVPQLTTGMQLLALVPACMALGNLGAFTYARDVRFERSVSIEVIPQLLITLAAWPVAVWLKDFRAFIWLQIGKAALSTLVSYVVGGRRHAFGFQKDFCMEIFRFSWPLMLSGFIMLCSSQGDRLLITKGFSLEQLGTYGVAYVLASAPSFALLKIVGGTALPILSRASGNHTLLRSQYALVAQVFSLCGALFAVGMVIAGEQVIVLLYGSKYAGTGILAAWLSCGHAVRMIRGAPTGVAWSRGETSSQMLGNVVRLAGLALVVPVIWLKGPLFGVAAAGLVGEVLALLAQTIAVQRRHEMAQRLCLAPVLTGAVCVGLAVIVAGWLLPERNLPQTAMLLVAGLMLTLLIFNAAFPEIGGEISKLGNAGKTQLLKVARLLLPNRTLPVKAQPSNGQEFTTTTSETNRMNQPIQQWNGYLEQKDSQIYYTVHSAAEPRALAVLAGPFASERVTTYAPWMRWARFLAQNGVTTLHFDYRGVGESTGVFEEMSVADWSDDLELCIRWLQGQNPGLPMMLHGLGFGGLLASNLFERGTGDALLLWSPPSKGDQSIREALLRRMSFDMVQAGAAEPKGAVDYLAQLNSGKPVSIEGYCISGRLWKDCTALQLAANGGDHAANGRPRRIIKLKQTEVPLVAGSGLWQALNPRARMRHCPLNPDLSLFFTDNLKWIREMVTLKGEATI